MSDDLLRYYNNELQYLRRQGNEFAKAYPGIADHLDLNNEGNHDPYVGRLVEAFAYLCARTRLKIDDEFPEIASSLIEILLPHYQRPIPSSSIVQFALDRSQTDLFAGYHVDTQSKLETGIVEGETSCHYRTCYPVECWPFEITELELRGTPFNAPDLRSSSKQPLGLLKVKLETFGQKNPFSKFDCNKLRFYISTSNPPATFQFYEMLFDSVMAVAIAPEQGFEKARFVGDAIREVGFAPDEGLVDYPPQSFPGYRLLSEYFSFPEKFFFFDLELNDTLKHFEETELCLYFYLDRRWEELEKQVDKDTLRLGCAPIVNLFKKTAERLRFEHFQESHVVIPSLRWPNAHEVYSIESVTGRSATKSMSFHPFYSFHHARNPGHRAFWHGVRREVRSPKMLEQGSEIEISFVDLNFNPLKERGNWEITLETLCTNRNLPSSLPIPHLQLEGGGAVEHVKCLMKPTAPFRPPMQEALRWRAVSHLTLNHLSLANADAPGHGAVGAHALRELLDLYDFQRNEFTSNSVVGLTDVRSKPIMGRVPNDDSGALCRGLEVMLHFDEKKYPANNLFLFASVIDRFLSLYVNMNAFTQTVAVSNQRRGELHRWAARAGQQLIV